MSRVGLITLHGHNYGSVLQCYATKRYVELLGYGCDVLNMAPRGIEAVVAKAWSLFRSIAACVCHPSYLSARLEMARAAKVAHGAISMKSREMLDLFEQSVLQPKDVSWALLKDARFADTYEWYITGSDQVWSTALLANPFMLLDFAEPEKRIALSPSFGMERFRAFNRRHFESSISRFQHLSVREDSGRLMIKVVTGRDVPVLADPVMLLSSQEWRSFAEGGKGEERSPYILAHFLDCLSVTATETIGLLSERLGLPVVVFAYPRDELGSLDNVEFVDGSPQDYVSLISHAEYVCTDSFHSIQFSILFNVKFLVFERMYAHHNRQDSRIETALLSYGCADRLIRTAPSSIENIATANPSFDARRREERRLITSYLDDIINNHRVSPADEKGVPADHQLCPVLKSQQDCVGCMACGAICPTGAIHFELGLLGQRLPRIDADACVNCHACERVCNGSKREDCTVGETSPMRAYISYSDDDELRSLAASAGAFATMADAFLRAGGLVAGSRLSFSEGKPTCEHVLVSDKSELVDLLGSKYVESDCTSIMPLVASRLRAGQKVLFCGTSCQVMGLIHFLEEKRVSKDGLYTMDLICHGVPGIGLFSEYVQWLGYKHKGKATSFSFREKTNADVSFTESVEIQCKGKNKILKIPFEKSIYYSMFMTSESYREACYHCHYATLDKPADITIGDYFEARGDYPWLFEAKELFYGVKTVNSVIVRTEKGGELLRNYGTSLVTHEVDPEVVQKSHRQLCRPGDYSSMRLRALEEWQKGGISNLQSAHRRRAIVKKAFRMLCLPLKGIAAYRQAGTTGRDS